MNDRFFIDTNILVYSFNNGSVEKRDIARKIIQDALTTGNGIISFQVLQEFLNVALKNFAKPLSCSDAKTYCEDVCIPLCGIFPGSRFYLHALELKVRTGFSFYDSLILQAALDGGCGILYSEDMLDGFEISGLKIVNPFKLSSTQTQGK